MRLRRLALPRYGIFTDHAVDFGPPTGGAPDLHVIYGPNEAGKSTLLAAFLDLLFAFEHRSRYGFAHGYDAMRVEAELELGDGIRRFARIRKRQGSLLDLDKSGQPAAGGETVNTPGGMNRDSYKAMFSLDDDTLEAGGEAILRSEGDLGQLLFAAGAGLVELREMLERLRGVADGFHRDRARKTGLHTLKTRLGEIEAGKKRLDTAASAYARLADERDRAKTAYDEATEEKARLETERDDAQRRLQGLPVLAEIRRLRAELDSLEALPEPPRSWFERIEDLIDREPRLATRIAELRKQKQRAVEKREAATVDDATLAVETRIARLDLPRGRYVTAEKDLPLRRSDLAKRDGAIAAIVGRLGEASDVDPDTLVIPAAAAGELRELIERRSGVEARRKAAEDEAKTAENTFERAKRALEEAGPGEGDPAAFDRLRDALRGARPDDGRARLGLHAEQLERLRVDCDARLAQLRPWSGGADELARVRAPETDELESWRRELEKTREDIERIEGEKHRLEAERTRLSDLAEAKKSETGVIDDREAERLREERDKAWTLLRKRLDAESAEAFEERLREDDAATANRIAHAAALADVRRAAGELRNTAAEIERNAADLTLARDRRRRTQEEMDAAIQTMIDSGAADLPSDISLPKLSGWLDRRAEILRILDETGRETASIERARNDVNRRRGLLAETLEAAGVSHDPAAELERLIETAESAVEEDRGRRTSLEAARDRFEQARLDLERRRRDAAAAEKGDAEWRAAWDGALSRCWLGGPSPAPSSAAVRRILEEVEKLESEIENHRDLARRIESMERDQDAYAAEVRELAELSGAAFDDGRVVASGDELKARLDAARNDRKRRDDLSKEIEEIAERIAADEKELAELRAVAAEMFEAFGVDSLLEAKDGLQKAARRTELRAGLADREAELVESMRADSSAAAEAALEGASRDELERRAAEIGSQLTDFSRRTNERFGDLQRAEDALREVSGDDAAARLDAERRTVLLEIEDGARDYLRLRLGVEAAERALAAYRDEHRSSMMKHASAAFRTISRGAYSGLDSQLTDKGEALVGVVAGGGSKIASEMSKGARFQLYLALRVAGYREFADRHGPVPFIADDILETFDDFRAEEAFRLFADMAEFGQVIYLSHHQHLCGIAREVCPSVTIHDLPGPATAPGRM